MTRFGRRRVLHVFEPERAGQHRGKPKFFSGTNMPYELLAKDFSKTNYSSARAALLEAWRFFMTRRQ